MNRDHSTDVRRHVRSPSVGSSSSVCCDSTASDLVGTGHVSSAGLASVPEWYRSLQGEKAVWCAVLWLCDMVAELHGQWTRGKTMRLCRPKVGAQNFGRRTIPGQQNVVSSD